MIEGSVDLVSMHNASGWIGDRESNRAHEIAITLYDEVIGEGPADLHRPDLEEVGFGDGRCGFDIGFYRSIEEHDLPFVVVRVRGSNLAVPRTMRESYVDYVRSVTGKYPGAGRPRSVYGGLWTDRTDALDVLTGRRVIGVCPARIYPKVRSFVAEGFVEVAGRPADAADGDGHDPVPAATPCISEEFADLLKAVFDDVPVLYATQEVRRSEEGYSQACATETMSSPAEMLVAYHSRSDGVRLDYVSESHELPEFGPENISRWTKDGTPVVPVIAAGSERPVKSAVLAPGTAVVVSPGLIHRISLAHEATATRLVLAPKRVTPVRFLSGTVSWHDYDLGLGIRARL